jgi:drug/metabolite transporter (DMT)-like permease
MMAGLYSACYLFALENGMTPGALASILGVQPILTLLITERRVTLGRATGLILSMLGLVMIVSEGIIQARFDILGIIFASASLIGITIGSILQKGEDQPPWKVLPLQYVSGLIIILALSPIGHYQASWNVEFLVPVLWLGLVVSVGATFVLYQLIASGNLVNVTSLFYLVPGETALLDWALLGNAMTIQMLTGLVLVIGGLMVAFRQEAN